MNAPLSLLFGAALGSTLTLILRRHARGAAAVSAGIAIALGFMLWLVPIEAPFKLLGLDVKLQSSFEFLGRELVITLSNRPSILLLYLASGLFFGGAWVARVPSSFLPIAHLTLATIACSLMVEPFLFAAIFLEMAAMGAVLILSPPRQGVNRGAVQMLMLFTLAMMAILATGWLLENAGVTSANPLLIQRVILLLGIGFAILLVVPPFHIWLPTAAQTAHAYALMFVLVILQAAGLFFLLRFLDTYAWLREHAPLVGALRTIGLIMLAYGAALALVQNRMAMTAAYLALSDFGLTILASAYGRYDLALSSVVLRTISLAVWALGWSTVKRNRLAWIAVVIGLLGLAGFPFTAGFPARWGLALSLGGLPAWVLFASSGVGALAAILKLTPVERKPRLASSLGAEEIYSLAGVTMSLAPGLLPEILSPWVQSSLQGLPNLLAG